MPWNTTFTNRFPCTIPFLAAPMNGVSGGKMAAEVCRAGGLGFLAAGHCNTKAACEKLEQQIAIFHSSTTTTTTTTDGGRGTTSAQQSSYPLCIGFISYSTFRDEDGWNIYKSILRKHNPAVVQFFAPAVVSAPTNHNNNDNESMATNISVTKEICSSCQVIVQVSTVAEAKLAIESGVDGLIVQGTGSGGHGVRREYGSSTLSIATEVMTKFCSSITTKNIPILAAGGIVDGRTAAALLIAGCDGVVLGTRLYATYEAFGNQLKKEALVQTSSCDDVIRTSVFDTIQNTYSNNPWPYPYDSSGVIQNQTTDLWEGKVKELHNELDSNNSSTVAEELKAADEKGDPAKGIVLAGEGIGLIDALDYTYDVVTRINLETINILQTKPKSLIM